ncbi:Uncharacterized protein SAPIO_CDS5294 [Scedosporium apiospermum]|uniref:YggU-like protein n=1 Tax=Pseudallescheria apiosperma TaxID=563466 RepID=A0A084G6A4_PSEDA|nr:Uncharacterized protein SAPIO_CDS5294 [Scedosporium apiospermum]KEZ42866.1 Uncharacterized protein SAPIO_CDS5294 [Scedosporium apiospermum]
MSAKSAIRFLAGTKKNPVGSLQLNCHVKPGASRVREGILSVSDEVIELCVSAQAREGEANKAVVKLFSEVLKKPKSEIQISHGMKSRDKTVVVSGVKEAEADAVRNVKEMLNKAVEEGT